MSICFRYHDDEEQSLFSALPLAMHVFPPVPMSYVKVGYLFGLLVTAVNPPAVVGQVVATPAMPAVAACPPAMAPVLNEV